MPSRRQERVAKRVIQELNDAMRNLKNVTLGFTTITRCEMSPDLRHAKVFVSVWGMDEEKERSLKMLRNHATKLRGAIGRPLGLKSTPQLHFEFDDAIATADNISRLIRQARDTDSNPEPLTPEEEAALRAVGAPANAGKFSGKGRATDSDDEVDVFETARQEIEEELLDTDDDDPSWRPINLDELPEDDDEEDDD